VHVDCREAEERINDRAVVPVQGRNPGAEGHRYGLNLVFFAIHSGCLMNTLNQVVNFLKREGIMEDTKGKRMQVSVRFIGWC
jgi:hypothetical protein